MRLPDPSKSRMVIIGNSDYADLDDLPQVSNTVESLRNWFTDPVHGIVPYEHCQLILDQPQAHIVGKGLTLGAESAEDLFLVYFAGHGLVGGRQHDLYLGTYHSARETPEFGSLRYESIKSAVLGSSARTKIIILDCCLSGRAHGQSLSAHLDVAALEVAGTYVLTSSSRDKVSLILPGEAHTAFSGRLLRVMREGIAEADRLLAIGEIYGHLKIMMAREGLPAPQSTGTELGGSIAITRNFAHQKERPILEAALARAAESAEREEAERLAAEQVLAEQERVVHEQEMRVAAARRLAEEEDATREAAERARYVHALEQANLEAEKARREAEIARREALDARKEIESLKRQLKSSQMSAWMRRSQRSVAQDLREAGRQPVPPLANSDVPVSGGDPESSRTSPTEPSPSVAGQIRDSFADSEQGPLPRRKPYRLPAEVKREFEDSYRSPQQELRSSGPLGEHMRLALGISSAAPKTESADSKSDAESAVLDARERVANKARLESQERDRERGDRKMKEAIVNASRQEARSSGSASSRASHAAAAASQAIYEDRYFMPREVSRRGSHRARPSATLAAPVLAGLLVVVSFVTAVWHLLS